MRPLGKIIGISISPKPVAPEIQKVDENNAEKNVFWEMAGYKDDGKKLPLEIPDAPVYNPPSQILRTLIHTGVMRRIRVSKEKSEYK